MTTRHTQSMIRAFTAAAALFAASMTWAQPVAAQPVTTQVALSNDVGTLSDKFVGLARVMAGKYDWRPGAGVRSVGDVFNLIIGENRMLAGLLSGTPNPAGAMKGAKPITDPAEMQEALRTSYEGLRKALTQLSDSDLNASVRMFGRDMTKQSAAFVLILDQHEHLGQS